MKLVQRAMFFLAIAGFVTVHPAPAQLVETVQVGNAGNAGDTRFPNAGAPNIGKVDYDFRISKFEVTAKQYTMFLNAVAASDPHGLYNPSMGNTTGGVVSGANIQRSGKPGSYTYSVPDDWADRPVNYVSWGDAARFANWLQNGQPTGPQSLTTTEDGAYHLNGATSIAQLMAVTRRPTAAWAIPTESEWYKAAYHKNDGLGSNYWNYPTASNNTPSSVLGNPSDPGNNATFSNPGMTIGPPYYRTVVGSHENSESPYGTFDQGGNVWEWNETAFASLNRGIRGGGYESIHSDLYAALRNYTRPTTEAHYIGFRIVGIPEPSTAVLLIAVTAFTRRRRRQPVRN
ncbi:Formylglycine-generating sulfatase enzyme [Phycisphaerae bacterium RAS2]|nr:Formylglycine-generating sulfatase enzyme [Phycisphaerae bacterium RAS2]